MVRDGSVCVYCRGKTGEGIGGFDEVSSSAEGASRPRTAQGPSAEGYYKRDSTIALSLVEYLSRRVVLAVGSGVLYSEPLFVVGLRRRVGR